MKIRDIGEQGLLERLQRFCPTEIVGDDAALLTTLPGQSLAVTTDVMVDGVHFSDRTTSPEDVGWRAAAANLSDLAAMGASPLGITVGLSLNSDVLVSWVERLYQGLTSCLQQYNTVIVGGDIVRSPVNVIAITAIGQVSPNHIIQRSAAQVGYAIVVTGIHGASRAGLELLLHPEQGQQLSDAERRFLIQAHQRPKPRLDVLPLLWEILDPKLETGKQGTREYSSQSRSGFTGFTELQDLGDCFPQSPIPIAGMDSSDGLADAILQICRCSHVGAKIERSWIPIPKALSQIVSPEQALNWALYGGEDFELVLCLALEKAQSLVKRLGYGAAIVGTITNDTDVCLVDDPGNYPDKHLTLNQGFQHFT